MARKYNNFLRLQKSDVASCELLLGIPSFVSKSRARGARARGIRYEKSVQELFRERYTHYIAAPWFKYTLRTNSTRINYAQPDGLLVDPSTGVVTIVEIKYAHVPDAYFQLVDKYLPLVQKFFEARDVDWQYALCEVVRWYDVATEFPCAVTLWKDVATVRPGIFAVHVCKP